MTIEIKMPTPVPTNNLVSLAIGDAFIFKDRLFIKTQEDRQTAPRDFDLCLVVESGVIIQIKRKEVVVPVDLKIEVIKR